MYPKVRPREEEKKKRKIVNTSGIHHFYVETRHKETH
jgi:hypothetical protein